MLKIVILNVLIIKAVVILGVPQMNLLAHAPIPPPNYAAISKLRALFFPEFYKKFDNPAKLEVICTGNVVLDISTKKCNCSKYICTKNSSFLRRIIDTSCDDFCCRKRAMVQAGDKQISARHISSNHEELENGLSAKHEQKCGVLNLDDYRRTEDSYLSFPWVVQIFSPMSQICIGTLIHPKVVMTTAVCIFMHAPEDITIQTNGHNVGNIEVADIITHEKFAKHFEKLDYDIALIILNKSIDLNDDVNTVCLAEENRFSVLEQHNCYVSSWEQDKSKKTFFQQNEHYHFMSNAKCQELHRTRRSKYENYFHDGNICAKSVENHSKQMTFSGAPLLCSTVKRQFTQCGILAWSTRVNRSPHIFTNVAKFTNWIDEKFVGLGLDNTVYKIQ